MPSRSSIIITLVLASTIVPTFAEPGYQPHWQLEALHHPHRDELIARELAYIIARNDESGALSWAEAKDIGKKVWDKAKQVGRAIAPYASTAASFLPLIVREEPELWVRLE